MSDTANNTHWLDELWILAESTGSHRIKETWKDWCFRVSEYLGGRMTQLKEQIQHD